MNQINCEEKLDKYENRKKGKNYRENNNIPCDHEIQETVLGFLPPHSSFPACPEQFKQLLTNKKRNIKKATRFSKQFNGQKL